MMKRLLLCVLLFACSSTVYAQQTPSQVYLAYREAFPKATSLEALQPYLSASVAAKATAVPLLERPKVLESLKQINAAFQVRIIAEVDTPDGHVMIVDGVDSGDRPIRGTVEMVKEIGGWKLSKETWHGR